MSFKCSFLEEVWSGKCFIITWEMIYFPKKCFRPMITNCFYFLFFSFFFPLWIRCRSTLNGIHLQSNSMLFIWLCMRYGCVGRSKIMENSYILSEHGKIVLLPFTFMVDPTMNLMSRPHHECERREYHSLYSKST